MKDHARKARQLFLNDPYAAKRAAAIKWLRSMGLYVLDAKSRKYTPSVPQDVKGVV